MTPIMDSISLPLEANLKSPFEDELSIDIRRKFFQERGKILLDVLTNKRVHERLKGFEDFMKKKWGIFNIFLLTLFRFNDWSMKAGTSNAQVDDGSDNWINYRSEIDQALLAHPGFFRGLDVPTDGNCFMEIVKRVFAPKQTISEIRLALLKELSFQAFGESWVSLPLCLSGFMSIGTTKFATERGSDPNINRTKS